MTAEQTITLKQTLELMFDSIAKKQNIIEALIQIEKIYQEIASTAPPMLIHYLKRRSYTKALDFLKEVTVVEDKNRPECED